MVDLSASAEPDQRRTRSQLLALADLSGDLHIGLVGFADYPVAPFGFDDEKAYQQLARIGVASQFEQAVAAMSFGRGGDPSEAQLDAIANASAEGDTGCGWRDSVIKRVMVAFTDSLCHGVDGTHTTSPTDATQALSDSGITFVGVVDGAEARECFELLATATGGSLIDASAAPDMVASTVEGRRVPTVNVGDSTGGQPVVSQPVVITITPTPTPTATPTPAKQDDAKKEETKKTEVAAGKSVAAITPVAKKTTPLAVTGSEAIPIAYFATVAMVGGAAALVLARRFATTTPTASATRSPRPPMSVPPVLRRMLAVLVALALVAVVTILRADGADGQEQTPVSAVSAFAPGGSQARAAGDAYFDKTTSCRNGIWRVHEQDLTAGVYYVDCDVLFENASGTFTLAATGTITTQGESQTFTPFLDDVSLVAGAPSGVALHVASTDSTYAGTLITGGGSIDVASTGNIFVCADPEQGTTCAAAELSDPGSPVDADGDGAACDYDDESNNPGDFDLTVMVRLLRSRNLRPTPSTHCEPLRLLRSGSEANISASTIDADGFRWARVGVDGALGWLAVAWDDGTNAVVEPCVGGDCSNVGVSISTAEFGEIGAHVGAAASDIAAGMADPWRNQELIASYPAPIFISVPFEYLSLTDQEPWWCIGPVLSGVGSASVALQACDGSTYQQWSFDHSSGQISYLSQCLQGTVGSSVEVTACAGARLQEWTFESDPSAPGALNIRSSDGRCLGIDGGVGALDVALPRDLSGVRVVSKSCADAEDRISWFRDSLYEAGTVFKPVDGQQVPSLDLLLSFTSPIAIAQTVKAVKMWEEALDGCVSIDVSATGAFRGTGPDPGDVDSVIVRPIADPADYEETAEKSDLTIDEVRERMARIAGWWSANRREIVLTELGDVSTLVHEIGHALGLQHRVGDPTEMDYDSATDHLGADANRVKALHANVNTRCVEPSPLVELFEDDEFGNLTRVMVEFGNHQSFEVSYSSVRWDIPTGKVLRLYDEENYQGPYMDLCGEGSHPDLDAFEAKAKSAKWFDERCEPTDYYLATFYDDDRYRGSVQEMLPTANFKAFRDIEPSSLRFSIPPGRSLILYSEEQHAGISLVLCGRGSIPTFDRWTDLPNDFGSADWGDSSECPPGTQASFDGFVSLYDEPEFNGDAEFVFPGLDKSNFGDANDKLSSLEWDLPAPHSVTLFSGASNTTDGGSPLTLCGRGSITDLDLPVAGYPPPGSVGDDDIASAKRGLACGDPDGFVAFHVDHWFKDDILVLNPTVTRSAMGRFHDEVSSIEWEIPSGLAAVVYDEPSFAGASLILCGRGVIRDLQGIQRSLADHWNDAISSVRWISAVC